MKLTAAVICCALIALAQAGFLADDHNGHVLHEHRSSEAFVGTLWRRSTRVESDAILPVRIGLKQNNLEVGRDRLIAVSHPQSKDYGRHLTTEEVHDLFAPADDTVNAVRDWLISAGVDGRAIAHSDNKGWLAADVPAEHAERLFGTELHEYEHATTGAVRIGCDSYHVPGHLKE